MLPLRYILSALLISAPFACARDRGTAETPEGDGYVPPPSTTNEPSTLPPDSPMPPESPPGTGTPTDTSGAMPGPSGTDKTLHPAADTGGTGGMGGTSPAPRGGMSGARSIGMR